jgi:hypothetical protein
MLMTTGHIRILTISIACVLCPCFVDSGSAQPQAAPNYYFCFSHPTADTAYFSGVFVIDYSIDGDARAWRAAGERERRDRNSPSPGPAPWVQQFDQFVAQTYPRTAKGAGACNSYGTLAETQKRLDESIQYEQDNKYNNKFKVVKTGWKYTPNPNATPPAPASQPVAAAPPAQRQGTAPVLIWDVCWVRGVDIQADPLQMAQAVFYVSGAMPLFSMADYHDVPSAFSRFIANKFKLPTGMTSSANCGQVQSLAEALSFIKQFGTTPAFGAPNCKRAHCIMTDWTNTPAASAPEPPAPAASRPGDPCFFDPHGMATAPPAGCVAPVTSYAVCYSANNQSTVYLSSAFAVTAMDNPSWINGFTQFLAQKYSYQGGGVGCNNMTLNIATTSLKNRIAALRANKKQVVETGWTFNSVPAVAVEPVPAPVLAAPSAAPVVPAAPATLYAVCWDATLGIRNLTAYFGVPFAVSARNDQVWATAFKSYLNDKYGSTSAGNVACNVSQSLAQAQQNAQQWKDRYSAQRKIIETGWKYQ